MRYFKICPSPQSIRFGLHLDCRQSLMLESQGLLVAVVYLLKMQPLEKRVLLVIPNTSWTPPKKLSKLALIAF